MRAHLPAYEMIDAGSLTEALARLRDEPGVWRPFAGGTDVMVLFEAGKLTYRKFMNIWSLRELRGIEVTDTEIRIGALTTYSELQRETAIQTEFPVLCRSSWETGAIAIQNRGTLGGNLANASPAADSSPALLIYDARVELISSAGRRSVPYEKFHHAYKKTELHFDELIHSIVLPRRPEDGPGSSKEPSPEPVQYFRKVGTRKAQAISKLSFAGFWPAQPKPGAVRIALGAVGPVPLRARQTEALVEKLLGGANRPTGAAREAAVAQARAVLAAEISPIDDIRSQARYRRTVAQNLLEEFLRHVELGPSA